MVKVEVTIKGIRPLLTHKIPETEEELKQSAIVTKTLSRNPTNQKAGEEEARLGLYVSDGKFCIPSRIIESALIQAGQKEKIKGRGNTTYKDVMKAFISASPEMIVIEPQKYTVLCTIERIKAAKNARVFRHRPKFENWKLKFQLETVDESAISLDKLREFLEYAGSYQGLGDSHPRYGRFEVVSWKELREQ